MTNEEKIEIRSRNVDQIGKLTGAQHLFIIYTNDKNEQFIIRGGTKTNDRTAMFKDNLHVIKAPYTEQYEHLFPRDLVDKAPSHVIAQGSDSKALFDKMWNIAQKVNAANLDYKLPIPYCPPELCHVQNSNTVVKFLTEKAGLNFELPKINGKYVLAPGVNGDLRHTEFDRELDYWWSKGEDMFSPGTGQCTKFDLSILMDNDPSLTAKAKANSFQEAHPHTSLSEKTLSFMQGGVK